MVNKHLSLRDYLAAKAMQSLLTTSPISYADGKNEEETNAQLNYIVFEAYRVADAMLQERKFNKPEQN
jgi:hypothetical protein